MVAAAGVEATSVLMTRLLGRSDVRTTERFYVHLAAQDVIHGARYGPVAQLSRPGPAGS